jgi:hypothetical protein
MVVRDDEVPLFLEEPLSLDLRVLDRQPDERDVRFARSTNG